MLDLEDTHNELNVKITSVCSQENSTGHLLVRLFKRFLSLPLEATEVLIEERPNQLSVFVIVSESKHSLHVRKGLHWVTAVKQG